MIEQNFAAVVSFGAEEALPALTNLLRSDMSAFSVESRVVLERPELLERFWSERKTSMERDFAERPSDASADALFRILMREGDVETAAQLLSRWDRLRGTSVARALARLRVIGHSDPGRVSEMLEYFGRQRVIDSGDSELILDVAVSLLRSGHRKESRSLLMAIDLGRTEGADVLARLAEAAWRVGEERVALSAASHSIAKDECQVRAQNIWACGQIRRSKFLEAAASLDSALDTDPLFRPALLNELMLSVEYLDRDVGWRRLDTYLDAYPSDLGFAHVVAAYAARCGESRRAMAVDAHCQRVGADAEESVRVRLLTLGLQARARAAKVIEYGWSDVGRRILPGMSLAIIEWAELGARYGTRAEIMAVLSHVGAGTELKEWVVLSVDGLADLADGDWRSARVKLRSAWKIPKCDIVVGRLLSRNTLFLGGDYGVAAEVAQQVLRRDSTRLSDWSNAVYGDLMAGRDRRARRKWRRVSARPAFQSLLSRNYCVRATRGLLRLHAGQWESGQSDYDAAAKMAGGGAASSRVQQKRDLELGKSLVRESLLFSAHAYLVDSQQGNDPLFSAEAAELLSRLDE